MVALKTLYLTDWYRLKGYIMYLGRNGYHRLGNTIFRYPDTRTGNRQIAFPRPISATKMCNTAVNDGLVPGTCPLGLD